MTATEGAMVEAATETVRAGSLRDLQAGGQLLTKLGALPVVVIWHEGRAFAVEDRCPHMGFPLHRGSVEAGLLTCHWHHARFDLSSGCTLDLFADDARALDVTVEGDNVLVALRTRPDPIEAMSHRLRDGLEEGLTLVLAKSVLGLLEAEVDASTIVRAGLEFGARYRAAGWGAGATVLTAMANLIPRLDPTDRALGLVHGLAFVSRDTRGQPPRFPLQPLEGGETEPNRLASWYRRFVDTRSGDAAERVLATALGRLSLDEIERTMFAAVTDHVFVDGGHTLDFTNKAFEALEHVGRDAATELLPTLVHETARASRSEELETWRHPHDLIALVEQTNADISSLFREGADRNGHFADVTGLGWRLLDEEPEAVAGALRDAARAGATGEQLGRGLAYAAALRVTRFHTQNDFGDWDTVHHAFTAANALHQSLCRNPTPQLVRGVVHGALRVYLDRFLNVPPARQPTADHGGLDELARCWEVQGAVDEAGGIAYGYLRAGGDPARLVAALGHALLREDAQFHWFQIFEAGVRQSSAWPSGSEEGALILAGLARFLAAHTPTRRELSRVVDIALRLRRGEPLYEEQAE